MIFKGVRRFLIGCLEVTILGALIIAALYVTIGRILISYADDYKNQFESLLAERLDARVKVDLLQGRWTYLDPGLVAEGFVVGEPDDPAIQLNRVFFKLDSVASLLEWNPVISELRIDGLRLTVAQDETGKWAVSGMKRREKGGFNTEFLLDSVPHLELVSLKDIEFDVEGRGSRYRVSSESSEPFELVNDRGVKTLSLPLSVQRITDDSDLTTVDQMELVGRYQGDPRDRSRFSAELYFKLPSLELTDFIPEVEFSGFRLAQAGVYGRFWFEYSEGGFSLTGVPVVSEIRVESADKDVRLLEDLRTEFQFSGTATRSYLHLPVLSARRGSTQVDLDGTNVTFAQDIVGHVPEVKLSEVGAILMELGDELGLIDERGLNALESMRPSGSLKDMLFVTNREGKGQATKLTASVEGAGIEPYLGSPGITNLNGFLSLTPSSGYIDVANQDTTLDFARMFGEPWFFDSARGRITYSYEPGLFQVSSGPIELTQGDLKARGKFHVNLPRERSEQTWGLVVGIENGALLDAHRYLPNVMPEKIREWLNTSVLGGTVVESGLVFHGSLRREAPKIQKVHELYFTVEDLKLDYDPKWPPVESMASTVYVGNPGVFSDGVQGTIFDSQLSHGSLEIPMDPEGHAGLIIIDGDINGPLSDGIRIFNESPLADITNNMAKEWSGTGSISGKIGLQIPIGERAGEEIYTDVLVSLKDNDLTMPEFNIDVEKISGTINYDNENGLVAETLDATLLDEPVKGSISSVMGDRPGEVVVSVSGKVDVVDLHAWSEQVLLTRASGLMTYDAAIHVPFGARSGEFSYVQARSDLGGVEIDLPEPMGKTPGDKTSFAYKQTFLEPGYRVEISLGDRVSSILKVDDGVVQGGHIKYGAGDPGVVAFDKIRVSGNLELVDYARWQEVTDDLEKHSQVSLSSELAGRLDAIDVDIGLLKAFGTELSDVHSRITRDAGYWNVELNNDQLSGVVRVADDDRVPVGVDLEYLKFPGGETEKGDPLAGFEPRELVAVDFSTRLFTIDGEDYGSWSFEFRPDETGAVLRDLQANVKGLGIVGPSEVSWRSGSEGVNSQFKGTVVTDDLANALEQWGFASSIEGKDFRFVADIRWPGSPAMISVQSIMGRVALTNGEGRFVQAESAGALKMLGIFDFTSLARRVRFDFSDIVDKGYSFEEIEGVVRFNKGVIDIVEPIEIEGASSILKIAGTIDLKTNNLDNDLIVTLPVNRNLPWYAAYSAIATGPLMGAGVILAQKIFENQIDQFSSAKYQVSGTLDEPKVEFVSIFADDMREVKPEEEGS